MEVKHLPWNMRDATWPWCPPTLWWCAWRINAAFTSSWNVFRSALCASWHTLLVSERKSTGVLSWNKYQRSRIKHFSKNHNPLHTKVMKDNHFLSESDNRCIQGLNKSNDINLTLIEEIYTQPGDELIHSHFLVCIFYPWFFFVAYTFEDGLDTNE